MRRTTSRHRGTITFVHSEADALRSEAAALHAEFVRLTADDGNKKASPLMNFLGFLLQVLERAQQDGRAARAALGQKSLERPDRGGTDCTVLGDVGVVPTARVEGVE